MRRRVARILLLLLGMSAGVGLAELTLTLLPMLDIVAEGSAAWPTIRITVYIAGILFGLLLALLFSHPLIEVISRRVHRMERRMQETPAADVIFGAVGLVLALVIAYLLTQLFSGASLWISIPLGIAVYIVMAYLGISIGSKRWREVPFLRKWMDVGREDPPSEAAERAVVVDTSAIIDGRLLDLYKTGFFRDPLLVPGFVLSELQRIADSADALRRNRGRRGLDMLTYMREEMGIVRISEKDYPEIQEVDTKLLRLAEENKCALMTVDYNLSKVAEVTGITVLNINELASALRPAMLPGEEMTVHIVKEGKEQGQGVAYLEDGTMVVVDNASRRIGQSIPIQVTSVLQTSAGRMIFGKA